YVKRSPPGVLEQRGIPAKIESLDPAAADNETQLPDEQYGVGSSADHCRFPGNLLGWHITNPPGDVPPQQIFR
ncbi:hypothetical protein THAOC_22429, partial [Thalassiosira oceanica]